MKEFNFNVPLIDAMGVTHPTETLGSALAVIIGQQTEGKTLKLFGWMQTLQVKSPLMLDESDKKDLENLIENDHKIFIFVKGQLLKILM